MFQGGARGGGRHCARGQGAAVRRRRARRLDPLQGAGGVRAGAEAGARGQDRVAREHAEESEDAGEARLGAAVLERLLGEEDGGRAMDPAAEPVT